jgi:lipid A 3-O-deacylase
VTGLLLASRPAWAEPAHFAFQGGWWGLGPNAEHSFAAQLEFRPGVRWWWVRPTGGLLQSDDGTQYWFAGAFLEIPLPLGFTLAPGFAPGLRTVNGTKNLGSVLLFKSSVELGLTVLPGLRALASFAHISNGKLSSPNPGVELLMFGVELSLE